MLLLVLCYAMLCIEDIGDMLKVLVLLSNLHLCSCSAHLAHVSSRSFTHTPISAQQHQSLLLQAKL